MDKSGHLPFKSDFRPELSILIDKDKESDNYRFSFISRDIEDEDAEDKDAPWFDLQISKGELDDIYQNLLAGLKQLKKRGKYFYTKNTDLEELMELGQYAFNRLFRKKYRLLLKEILSNNTIIQIIAPKEFLVPWELFYDGDLDSLDINGFWGMRHVISRWFQTIDINVRPELSIRPKVGLIVDDRLDAVKTKEIPTLKIYNQQNCIFLSKLQPLDKNYKRNSLRIFSDFLKDDFDIIHFACHFWFKEKDTGLGSNHKINEYYFRISDDFVIKQRYFKNEPLEGIQFKNAPLLILNACNSGTMLTKWPDTFIELRPRAILATEFSVYDDFAAEFINKIYSYLCNNMEIGESLLLARRYFGEKGQLFGLGYTLYLIPTVRIANDNNSSLDKITNESPILFELKEDK